MRILQENKTICLAFRSSFTMETLMDRVSLQTVNRSSPSWWSSFVYLKPESQIWSNRMYYLYWFEGYHYCLSTRTVDRFTVRGLRGSISTLPHWFYVEILNTKSKSFSGRYKIAFPVVRSLNKKGARSEAQAAACKLILGERDPQNQDEQKPLWKSMLLCKACSQLSTCQISENLLKNCPNCSPPYFSEPFLTRTSFLKSAAFSPFTEINIGIKLPAFSFLVFQIESAANTWSIESGRTK